MGFKQNTLPQTSAYHSMIPSWFSSMGLAMMPWFSLTSLAGFNWRPADHDVPAKDAVPKEQSSTKDNLSDASNTLFSISALDSMLGGESEADDELDLTIAACKWACETPGAFREMCKEHAAHR